MLPDVSVEDRVCPVRTGHPYDPAGAVEGMKSGNVDGLGVSQDGGGKGGAEGFMVMDQVEVLPFKERLDLVGEPHGQDDPGSGAGGVQGDRPTERDQLVLAKLVGILGAGCNYPDPVPLLRELLCKVSNVEVYSSGISKVIYRYESYVQCFEGGSEGIEAPVPGRRPLEFNVLASTPFAALRPSPREAVFLGAEDSSCQIGSKTIHWSGCREMYCSMRAPILSSPD